jgi:hypothetical protein
MSARRGSQGGGAGGRGHAAGSSGGLWTDCPEAASGKGSGYLAAGYHVITAVQGGHNDSSSGSRVCGSDEISVPLVVYEMPRATMTRLVCTELCNSEVPSAMIELQQGLPPFTVQLKDQVLNLLALLVQKYKY